MEEERTPLITSQKGGDSNQHHEGISTSGVRIVFRNLVYQLPSVVKRGRTVTILHNMSGAFNAGEMTAIMGPSGCGKSMMMDVLAGRRTGGKLSGTITYAGVAPSQMFLRRVTGYVEQFGTLAENLSVFEMLMYTAELKRPMEESYASKKASVNILIQRLALEKCRDTKIGDPQLDRGISGGQAKRVNMAIALITNPRVLYMDEPISGLDSYTANEVMDLVKKLTADGLTLIATLHSPTPFVFNLFEKICLLLRGHIVYFGKRDQAIPFFESRVSGDVISADSDAEWLTDVIVKADAAGRADSYANYYDESEHKQKLIQDIDAESVYQVSDELAAELSHGSATVTPWWFGGKTYFKYRTSKNFKDSKFWGTRLPDKIVLALMVGSVYWGIGDNLQSKNFTNVVAVYASWTFLAATGTALYVPSLITDRKLFYRERRDGLYLVGTYVMVRFIEELIVAALISVFVTAAACFMIDLQGSYLLFFIVYFGNFSCGIACAFFFVSVSQSIDAALGGLSTYMTTLGLFCGFYIRLDDMPVYLRWYAEINFIRYSLGALIINHYDTSDEGRRMRLQLGDDATETGTAMEFMGAEGHGRFEYAAYIYLFALFYAIIAYLGMRFVRLDSH